MSDKEPFDLTGRVAVVTGGSRGLGREIVLGLARHGADVTIASRKQANCDAVAQQVQEETGRRAVGVACHVGDWSDCDRLANTAYEAFGRVDILVNNAGMSPVYPSLDEVTEDLWDKVLAVNLKGPFRLATHIGTRMAGAGGGSIINVSSVAAVQPTWLELPYGMAKAALHNMTAGLAHSLQGRVRVNAIMPGPFLTDISRAWPQAFHDHIRDSVPMGRAGEPNEIVGAALYLASDVASYTSGAVIKVDGGWAYAPG